MSERTNVVLVPTPRTPESALTVHIELEKEPKEPWEVALLDTLKRTMEEIMMLRSMAGNYLLGNPLMNLPPAPTALPHILTSFASLAKTIAAVIESQIANMERMTNKEEAVRFASSVLDMARKLFHAYGMTIAEYTSTVMHGLVTAQDSNSWAEAIATGMAPFKTGGEIAVQQERR